MGKGLSFGWVSTSSSEALPFPVARSWVIELGGDPSVSSDEYYQEGASDKWMVGPMFPVTGLTF